MGEKISNSEIIAIIGILASIITTVFGGWLLNKQLNKKSRARTKSAEDLEAAPRLPHEPSPASLTPQGPKSPSAPHLPVSSTPRPSAIESTNLAPLTSTPTASSEQSTSPEQPVPDIPLDTSPAIRASH